MEDSPDPLETVTVLKSDFELLQKVADCAVADTAALGELLGLIRPIEMAPREFFHTVILPRVAALLETQSYVDKAKLDIKTAAERFGKQTITIGDGVEAVKVGQRDPQLAAHLMGLTRAERREWKRRQR